MKHFILIIIALASSIINVSAQIQQAHLPYELPAPLKDRPEQIIHHTGYTLSYNTTHGTPNWSAWVLTKSHVQNSSEPRSPQFFADSSVPIAYRVLPTDYAGSGYDRGHLYPAADASWSTQSMHDCFYMSNMCPQVPALNRVSWKALESRCRFWVMTEDTLYIVAGPVYKSSTVSEGFTSLREPQNKLGSAQALEFQKVSGVTSIGKSHKIDVPTGFFKVVLSLRRGHAKTIGFYYVNSAAKQSLSGSATTVDAIEKLTGIDFFCSLEDSLEEQLESHCNLKDWK